MELGTWADWFVAVTTLLVAIIAVFQDWIRSLVFAPALRASITTSPPDCIWIPLARGDGFKRDAVFARLLIHNDGPTTALDVEVYARTLRRLGVDGGWHPVRTFPPMNLTWADLRTMYVSGIAPHTAKYCDLGHLGDPLLRKYIATESNPSLVLGDNDTAFVFATVVIPNHMGHIIPAGSYEVDVVMSAKNARATVATIGISFDGMWRHIEEEVMAHGIHVQVVRQGERP